MEVWWNGFIAPPEYLLCCIGTTYLLLLGYNKYAGMKEGSSFFEICWDSVEEIGLAFIVSFLFLLLISRIDFGMSLSEIAGKVIVVAMIVAIGISVGTAQLGDGNGKDSNSDGKGKQSKSGPSSEGSAKKDSSIKKRIILTICGSVLIASSVAPTEEILLIAVSSNSIQLLLMVLVSLLITGIILYFSDFKGAAKTKPGNIPMFVELAANYIIALFVAFAFLWFFGRVQDIGLNIVVAQIIVLGIPGTIGASAGRLLIAG